MAKPRPKIRPHPDSLIISRALERVADQATAINGVAYRACEVQYANRDDLITGAGSRQHGGRWNPRGKFHAVYLSFDIQVALAEYLGQYHRFGLKASAKIPVVIASVEICLQRVLDLTDGSIRRSLGISLDRIVADDWVAAQDRDEESLTQAIGRIAHGLELEGLQVPCALQPIETNLVYYPANLMPPRSWTRIVHRGQLPKSSGQ